MSLAIGYPAALPARRRHVCRGLENSILDIAAARQARHTGVHHKLSTGQSGVIASSDTAQAVLIVCSPWIYLLLAGMYNFPVQ